MGARRQGDPFEQYVRQREIEEHTDSRGTPPARRADPPPHTGQYPPQSYGPDPRPAGPQLPPHQLSVPPPPPAYAADTTGYTAAPRREFAEDPTGPAPGTPHFGRATPAPTTAFGTGTGAPSFIASTPTPSRQSADPFPTGAHQASRPPIDAFPPPLGAPQPAQHPGDAYPPQVGRPPADAFPPAPASPMAAPHAGRSPADAFSAAPGSPMGGSQVGRPPADVFPPAAGSPMGGPHAGRSPVDAFPPAPGSPMATPHAGRPPVDAFPAAPASPMAAPHAGRMPADGFPAAAASPMGGPQLGRSPVDAFPPAAGSPMGGPQVGRPSVGAYPAGPVSSVVAASIPAPPLPGADLEQRRRGRHAAPDERANAGGHYDIPDDYATGAFAPPDERAFAGEPAGLDMRAAGGFAPPDAFAAGPAGLVDPRLDPWQHPGPAARAGTGLEEATSLVAPPAPPLHGQPPQGWPDGESTQLHQFPQVVPDLDSPTEMIPPDRLGLAPQKPGPGPDISGIPGADRTDDDDDDRIPPRPRRVVKPPRRRRPRWVRALAWSGAFLGIFILGIGGFAVYEYQKINHNINRVDALAPNDPSIKDAAKQLDAENFLLIGSDTREGANAKYGADKTSGQRSDTTILAHLSPDRKHATLISFPRDAWVTIPDCQTASGNTVTEHDGMFNSAFETGGPNCTIRTLQRLTGIAINHYVQVDFNGFKAMVDAVGGVPVCSTERVYDKDSGLRLNPGQNVLHGEQALSFVRARHNLGDGSDLDRIKRQQAFLGSMMRVATSNKILLNPVRLTKFLNAASKSVTLDKQTSLNDLRRLGSQVQGLDPKRVTFLTAPIANRDYDPTGQRATGGGRVLLDAAQGLLLWQSIINDRAVPKTAPKSGAPKPANTATVTVSPEQVSVKVINGVGTDHLASTVATKLSGVGFQIADRANTAERPVASIIRYAPANKAAAVTLAAAVPGSVLSADATLGQRLDLVVGSSYSTVRAVQLGQQVTLANAPATSGGASTQSTGGVKPSPQPSINAGDTSICV